MRLVPAYTPDPDYIDRQIDAELAAEHDQAQAPTQQSGTGQSDTDKIAS
ncbi:MAG: hypothetical protein WBG53_19415 [Rhodococcus sp. (in: high G+C Gram-positive bacteria)]|nr:hypothetical protein [Rhodococcus sp. KRD197]